MDQDLIPKKKLTLTKRKRFNFKKKNETLISNFQQCSREESKWSLLAAILGV